MKARRGLGNWPRRAAVIGALFVLRLPASGQEAPVDLATILAESRTFSAETPRSLFTLTDDVLAPAARRARRLDLSPLIERFATVMREQGIPLKEKRDPRDGDAIGVAASFSMRQELPEVRFQAGAAVEPLGAFYDEDGFRCSLVWASRPLSFRLEGGEDSEFGYFGIAGTQWTHPHRPIAVGVGMPMRLRDAEGDVGVVVQLRMKFR